MADLHLTVDLSAYGLNLSPFISEKIDTEVFNVIKRMILIQTDQFLLLQQ